MKEVIPQFTYADKVLSFNIPASHEPEEAAFHADRLEALDTLASTEVQAAQNGHQVNTDMSYYMTKGPYTPKLDEALVQLLRPLTDLLPYKTPDDVVLSVGSLGRLGPTINVYPSAQTWLQKTDYDSELLVSAMSDMLALYGQKPTKRFSVSHWGVDIGRHKSDFQLTQLIDTGDTVTQRTGLTTFITPTLQTIGDCACIGSSASDRSIYLGHFSDLYPLAPHNVDTLRDSLSLLVGLGSLALQVPRTFDEAELLRDVEWEEAIYPKVPR